MPKTRKFLVAVRHACLWAEQNPDVKILIRPLLKGRQIMLNWANEENLLRKVVSGIRT